eukprot:766496-Hanusia_phi.AAC.4
MQEKNAQITIIPRRSSIDKRDEKQRSAITLRSHDIVELFHLQQKEAAKRLGVSLTTLKMACRKLRLPRWPYTRQNCPIKSHDTWDVKSFHAENLMNEAFMHCTQ